jgi:hypothetical protein
MFRKNIKAQKMHLFRLSLGFLVEAKPRLENRRGEKALFGQGTQRFSCSSRQKF